MCMGHCHRATCPMSTKYQPRQTNIPSVHDSDALLRDDLSDINEQKGVNSKRKAFKSAKQPNMHRIELDTFEGKTNIQTSKRSGNRQMQAAYQFCT